MPSSESCHACDHEFRRHERRRREIGVEQTMKIRSRSCRYVGLWSVGGWADLVQTCCLGPLATAPV